MGSEENKRCGRQRKGGAKQGKMGAGLRRKQGEQRTGGCSRENGGEAEQPGGGGGKAENGRNQKGSPT